MKCPRCTDGKCQGFVDFDDGHGGLTGGYGSWLCGTCHGTGQVDDRMDEWMRIGDRLHNIRVARRETLRAMATRTGISAGQISRWEAGEEDPSGHPDYKEISQ